MMTVDYTKIKSLVSRRGKISNYGKYKYQESNIDSQCLSKCFQAEPALNVVGLEAYEGCSHPLI